MIPMNDIKCDEQKAIDDLRMRMKGDVPSSINKDPTLFYRFLKARDFDVNKAEKMLRKHITWRKAHQVDTILQDLKAKEVFCKYVEPSVIGLDKDGEVVIFLPVGKLNSHDVLKCIKMNELMKNFVWFLEKLKASIHELNIKEKRSFNLNQISVVFDLDKLTFSNTVAKPSIDGLLRLTSIAQDNNPEFLKSVYIINAPSYFVLAYSVLKAMMSNAMIQKLHFYSHNTFQKPLLEVIDADVLPAFLGGDRTDPDGNPLCSTFITHPGNTNPKYYLSNEDRYFEKTSQVEKIVVPPMGKKEIDIDITEKGSVIHWRFYIKRQDIEFALSFKTPGQDAEEILPSEKYITTDGTEEGYYKAKSLGKYILTFSNSFSWICSKEIEYCVTVVKPQ